MSTIASLMNATIIDAMQVLGGICEDTNAGLVILLCGYAVTGILLVGYFVWEAGPCHYTRWRESVYIASSLSIVPFAGFLMGARKVQLCGAQVSKAHLAALLFNEAMEIVLILQICQSNVWAVRQPTFFESRPFMPRPKIKASKYGGGIAREVESTITDVLDLSPAIMEDSRVASAVFVLLMVQKVIWASDALQTWASLPLGASFFLAVVIGVIFTSSRLRTIAPMKTHLLRVVRTLCRKKDKEALQFVLCNVSVATMFEICGEPMIKLLREDALEADFLSLLEKAILVDALQSVRIRFSRGAQEAVLAIMRSCRGQDLTALKNMIDAGGNYLNLHHLVYHELCQEMQDDLLEHLRAESDEVRFNLASCYGVKVVSDIDDTLFSSGGRFPAGVDKSYPKGAMYPGCLTLYRLLDKQVHEYGSGQFPPCNLVFLSARPHVYKGTSEDVSYRLFSSLVQEGRMHSMPTLLPGRKRHGLGAIMKFCWQGARAWRDAGEYKVETFKQYRELYREYDFVFCGDSGQGDLLAAQKMLDDSEAPSLSPFWSILSSITSFQRSSSSQSRSRSGVDIRGRRSHSSPRSRSNLSIVSEVRAQSHHDLRTTQEPVLLVALIHEVMPRDEALALEPPGERDRTWDELWHAKRLLFHRSYIDAAMTIHRYSPRLITADDLRTIAADAVFEFQTQKKVQRSFRGWQDAEEKLVDDFRKVQQYLESQKLPRIALKQKSFASKRHETLWARNWSLTSESSDTDYMAREDTDSDGASARPTSCCCCPLDTVRGSDRRQTFRQAAMCMDSDFGLNSCFADSDLESESEDEDEEESLPQVQASSSQEASATQDGVEWSVRQDGLWVDEESNTGSSRRSTPDLGTAKTGTRDLAKA
eukprot:TRINITY_DN14715_c0_g1_i2.p1 TRINITY_DN14715_c0_g1~~TRINITY_DN14715_c0_g1_i2.p1  ORF type:complete len:876 (+),score=161.70 TRINITY_DN14715_c0_g1_i2:57-2684(+)